MWPDSSAWWPGGGVQRGRGRVLRGPALPGVRQASARNGSAQAGARVEVERAKRERSNSTVEASEHGRAVSASPWGPGRKGCISRLAMGSVPARLSTSRRGRRPHLPHHANEYRAVGGATAGPSGGSGSHWVRQHRARRCRASATPHIRGWSSGHARRPTLAFGTPLPQSGRVQVEDAWSSPAGPERIQALQVEADRIGADGPSPPGRMAANE